MGKKALKLTLLILLTITVCGAAQAQQTLKSDSLVKAMLIESEANISSRNTVYLLKQGRQMFNDMLEVIAQAQHHIHIEYYIFNNDSIGNVIIDLLVQKSREGVEVRVLQDGFGDFANKRFSRKKTKELLKQGVELVSFDPMRFPYLQHVLYRDHRKIVVIDGKVGFMGGMNVGDEYINGIPHIGEWRDTHMHIEGEAVHHLQALFLELWNKTTKQHIGGKAYYPPMPEPINDTEIAIVDRYPKKRSKLMRESIEYALHSAQQHIQIINPYFVPTKGIKKELKKALKRGVAVEIMVPAKADIRFTPDAVHYTAYQFSKKGAEVYLFEKGFNHSKVMTIDEQFCTIGSTNLDSRSLRYDYEVNAFIFDKEITREISEMFEADKQQSTLLNKESWKKKSKWKRFSAWFAHLFTPVL